MTSAKRALLFSFTISLGFALSSQVGAQDEFIESEAPPPPPPPVPMGEPEEIFEEEALEPIEGDIVRPEPYNEPILNSFPEPRRLNSSNSRSSGGPRRLPDLPPGVTVPKGNEKLRMDFVQVELEELVKYFAERLRKKFIYDPSTLQGKITIISPTEVTLNEAWGAFLSALEVRGYIVYPAGPYLKLEKAANARKSPVPVYAESTPDNDQYVTRIIMLKYLSVNDIRQAVRNLLSRTGGDVIEHPQTNTLIISDYAYNIRRIVRILNILDVEGFQEQIEVIQLKNAAANDVAQKVTQFFPPAQASGAAQGSIRSRIRAGQAGANASAGSVIQKVVADERTNSLIVLGSDRGIEQVKRFIQRIDVPVEGGGGQIHVYPLQNVKAEDISQTLAALASGPSNRRTTGAGAANPNLPAALNVPNQSGGTSASLLSGEVKITADNTTNSLVIQASPRDFEVLKSIIKKLDVRLRQVFIESVILEASVGNSANFGTRVVGPLGQTTVGGTAGSKSGGFFGIEGASVFNLEKLFENSASLAGLALGFRSGKTLDFKQKDPATGAERTVSVPLLSAVINLAATTGNVNILSTPHILTTANKKASLTIGDEIAQSGGVERSATGVETRNVQRINLDTVLEVTPQINASDYVTLEISQSIKDINNSLPTVDGNVGASTRKANTTVIVKDGQTVVLGGLMRDRENVEIKKVPFLGDIPVLGWLFKSRSKTVEKVNFLLFLTPYIINDTGNLNDRFFKKFQERSKFLNEMGIEERKGIPLTGLTDEQKEMLDPDYLRKIKGLELTPLTRSTTKISEEAAPIEVAPTPQTDESFPAPEAPVTETPGSPSNDQMNESIPVGPINTPLPENNSFPESNEGSENAPMIVPPAPQMDVAPPPAPEPAPMPQPEPMIPELELTDE